MDNRKTVTKDARIGGFTSRPTEEELKLINAYTRQAFCGQDGYF